MVRTVIIPQKTDVHISVPESYIGKEIEILIYAKEEIHEQINNQVHKTMASYKGIITKEQAADLQNYIKASREEWK